MVLLRALPGNGPQTKSRVQRRVEARPRAVASGGDGNLDVEVVERVTLSKSSTSTSSCSDPSPSCKDAATPSFASPRTAAMTVAEAGPTGVGNGHDVDAKLR